MKQPPAFFAKLLAIVLMTACSCAATAAHDPALQDRGGNEPGSIDQKHHTAGGFRNYPPAPEAVPMGPMFYLRRAWNSVFLDKAPAGRVLPQDEALRLLKAAQGDGITWLGHATFLIRTAGKTILTDPFLTERASPFSWIGPRRYVPPGIPLEKLPPLDGIVVSHNHYDHLDEKTVRALPHKNSIHVVVPLGLKGFFSERGYGNVTELDWGEETSLDKVKVIALPAAHDSARNTSDRNRTLWASWAIISPAIRIYFVGDSAYSDSIFKEIGGRWGPFDYAILPIGAYEPRKLMSMHHVTPEEAVSIGRDTRAKTLIASHWGTINLSDEPQEEPPERFLRAGEQAGMREKDIWILKIGETRAF